MALVVRVILQEGGRPIARYFWIKKNFIFSALQLTLYGATKVVTGLREESSPKNGDSLLAMRDLL
jgi:hypothetical protein